MQHPRGLLLLLVDISILRRQWLLYSCLLWPLWHCLKIPFPALTQGQGVSSISRPGVHQSSLLNKNVNMKVIPTETLCAANGDQRKWFISPENSGKLISESKGHDPLFHESTHRLRRRPGCAGSLDEWPALKAGGNLCSFKSTEQPIYTSFWNLHFRQWVSGSMVVN